MDAVKGHNGAVEYMYVDVDKHPEIAQMLQISSIPVCFMVRNGDLVEQMVGIPRDPKGLENFIQKGLKADNSEKK